MARPSHIDMRGVQRALDILQRDSAERANAPLDTRDGVRSLNQRVDVLTGGIGGLHNAVVALHQASTRSDRWMIRMTAVLVTLTVAIVVLTVVLVLRG